MGSIYLAQEAVVELTIVVAVDDDAHASCV